MNEYEHLKKQKEEMIERHKAPGSKCPFGCPHDAEKYVIAELATLRAELERAKEVIAKKDNGLKEALDWFRTYRPDVEPNAILKALSIGGTGGSKA